MTVTVPAMGGSVRWEHVSFSHSHAAGRKLTTMGRFIFLQKLEMTIENEYIVNTWFKKLFLYLVSSHQIMIVFCEQLIIQVVDLVFTNFQFRLK